MYGIWLVSVASWILVTPMDVALRVFLLCGIVVLTVASWHGLRRRLGGDKTGTSPSVAMNVLRPFRSADGVGHFAEEGMRQVEEAEAKCDGLMTLVSDMFSEGSISWRRFLDAVAGTCDAIKANAMTMSEEIELTHDLDACDIRSQNPIATEMRRERRRMHDSRVTSISDTLRDNERLLFEMDKLREELLLLRQRDISMDNKDALDEIQRLIRDTPSYT